MDDNTDGKKRSTDWLKVVALTVFGLIIALVSDFAGVKTSFTTFSTDPVVSSAVKCVDTLTHVLKTLARQNTAQEPGVQKEKDVKKEEDVELPTPRVRNLDLLGR